METIVFTNGCFDLIHSGHIDLLRQARALGTKLIVGLNSDASIRAIKGAPRPYVSQTSRAKILESIRYVDEVKIFEELTPEKLIKEIKPNILVKGGDWKIEEIIGADFIQKNGGKVFSIPLTEDFSSSGIVEKITNSETSNRKEFTTTTKNGLISDSLKAHVEVFQTLLSDGIKNIENCGELILKTLLGGNKILICGNGGSAADAQHIAAEFVGRYETERKALPAIALTTDTSALTALANDYGFERVFARQVEALARQDDLLIAISTSGNSPNVNAAIMAARHNGCRTLGMTGADGKKLASLCDSCLIVPESRTARIQEAHITIAHIWCEMIDFHFNKANPV